MKAAKQKIRSFILELQRPRVWPWNRADFAWGVRLQKTEGSVTGALEANRDALAKARDRLMERGR